MQESKPLLANYPHEEVSTAYGRCLDATKPEVRVHPDRAACGDCNHCHPGGYSLPGLRPGPGEGAHDRLHFEYRQIGTGLMMYIQDYDDTFPVVTFYSRTGANSGNWG